MGGGIRTFFLKESDRFEVSTTSKGNQIKWLVKDEDGKLLYIKADQFGYESISEALVSEFLRFVEGVSFVDYSFCRVNEDSKWYNCCYSENLLAEGEDLTSLYRLLKSRGIDVDRLYKDCSGKELALRVISLVREVTGYDITDYLKTILSIDWLILNEDRHLNNIALVVGEDGKYRDAPLFDNGLSLLSDVVMYPTTVSEGVLIKQVKSKPFSTSFKKQVRYLSDEVNLRVDFKGFKKELDSCCVPFNEAGFLRARRVLLGNLSRLEGIVWERL